MSRAGLDVVGARVKGHQGCPGIVRGRGNIIQICAMDPPVNDPGGGVDFLRNLNQLVCTNPLRGNPVVTTVLATGGPQESACARERKASSTQPSLLETGREPEDPLF